MLKRTVLHFVPVQVNRIHLQYLQSYDLDAVAPHFYDSPP
jgi:hypothetical protein